MAISSAKLALLGCFRALADRVASVNPSPSSFRSEFSPDVRALATSPKLEIHAPTQCFVRVRRSCRSVHTPSDKRRGNHHFGLENRALEHPGSVPRTPGRAKSGGKTRAGAQSDCRSHFFWPVERARRDAGPDAAPARSARSRSAPNPGMRIVEWIYVYLYIYMSIYPYIPKYLYIYISINLPLVALIIKVRSAT